MAYDLPEQVRALMAFRHGGMAPTIPALAMTLSLAVAGAAAKPLVIDGETISEDATFTAGRAEGTMTLFGSWPERYFAPVKAAFENDTGITIDYLRLATQMLYPRVTAEFAAGRLVADYVDLTDPTLMTELVRKGVIDRAHKIPGFDRVAPELREAEGRWYVVFRLPQVIGVNTAVVPKADRPRHWLDLLEPRWHGRIGIPSIDAGGSAFTTFAFLREKIALNFWSRLAANAPRIYPATSPTVADLSRGEVSVIAVGSTTIMEQIDEGAPLELIFPPEGSPAFPVVAGITATARHPNAAAVFLDWMTSRRGGNELAKQGTYPLNPEAVPPVARNGAPFPPATQLWNIDVDHWQRVRDPYMNEWHTIFQK
jgi:iron(III) transport system substrate-binding protein